MPFLTIGTYTDVPIAIDGARQVESELVGEIERAFAGNLRSTVRAAKRVWEVTTGALSLTEANQLRSQASFTAAVNCSGDLMTGATVSCFVTITESEYIPDSLTTQRQIMQLRIQEV